MIPTLAPWDQCLIVAAGASAAMLAGFLVQLRTRDAGIVDALWAAGLGAAAIFAGLTGAGEPGRRVLIAIIGGVWGFRLAAHILLDRVLKGPEDGRYQMMREKLGGRGPRVAIVFFLFFQAQALLIAILGWPFLLAAASPSAAFPAWTDALGAVLWLTGITGEWTADRQLKAWKANPANRSGRSVCDVGLWRYSRHPNYFFEWFMWCAYATIAAAYAPPLGPLAFLAPAFMLVLVLKVTGIPPTEARALKTRGDAYRRYQQTTSAFVPWFPKEAPR